jgi:hypothetical protein
MCKDCVVWIILVSNIRNVEDTEIRKSEHGGRNTLLEISRTLERNGQEHKGVAEEWNYVTVGATTSYVTEARSKRRDDVRKHDEEGNFLISCCDRGNC